MREGQTIGAWVLERKLGEGAMGEVWRAHRGDDPTVVSAFKRIKGEITAQRAQRFLREAAILADLDHPGVPAFLDYGAQPPFLAMEFVEGASIGSLIRERGPFSVADALEVTRQLVDAIAYLHGRDIWHRDIKPDNLILTRDGWLKLVDFGVARGEGYADLTAAGMLVGTIAYMPPEAFRGSEAVPLHWDLYAAGVVLHRCLTGRNGFETSLTGVRAQAEQAQLKLALPCLDPGESVPDAVRELIRDLTRQDPDQRLTSPGRIGRRLQGLLREFPGSDLAALGESPRATAPASVASEPRRGRGAIVALLVVVAVSAVLAAGGALVGTALLALAIAYVL